MPGGGAESKAPRGVFSGRKSSMVNVRVDGTGLSYPICSTPEHCIDPRRLPLFTTRSTLRDLIAGLCADANGLQASAFSSSFSK